MKSLFNVSVELDLSDKVSDVSAFTRLEIVPSVVGIIEYESVSAAASNAVRAERMTDSFNVES